MELRGGAVVSGIDGLREPPRKVSGALRRQRPAVASHREVQDEDRKAADQALAVEEEGGGSWQRLGGVLGRGRAGTVVRSVGAEHGVDRCAAAGGPHRRWAA